MAGEVTIPLLPCASIDVMRTFYEALGFHKTYYQTKPNPYVAMRREDMELHFFGMDGFEPADSYSTCVVQVPDTGELHASFAEGLRALLGKVPLAGIPRMTRPRKRKNVGNLAGFSVVDPGGNWIRFFPVGPERESTAQTRLARTMENAIVQADSRGDHKQAAKILDGGIAHATPDEPVTLVEALAYRAELAITLEDPERAAEALARLAEVELTAEDRIAAADALAAAEELRATLDN